VRPAWAVRTFALVAMRIPMKPASAEKSAPIRKETTISGWLRSSFIPRMKRRPLAMAAKMASTRYSAFRKARAPAEMCPAISRMTSVPGSCRETQAERQAVYSRASRPSTGIT
jgi:hypothetical protein